MKKNITLKQGLLHQTPQGLMRCRCQVGSCPYGGPHARSLSRQRRDKDGNLLPRPELPAEYEHLPFGTAGVGKHLKALEEQAEKAGSSFEKANTEEQNARLFAAALRKQRETCDLKDKSVAEVVANMPNTTKAEGPLGVAPFIFTPEAQAALKNLKDDIDTNMGDYQEKALAAQRAHRDDSYSIKSKITSVERDLDFTLRSYGERLNAIVTDEEVYTPAERAEIASFLDNYEKTVGPQLTEADKKKKHLDALEREMNDQLTPLKELEDEHQEALNVILKDHTYSSPEYLALSYDDDYRRRHDEVRAECYANFKKKRLEYNREVPKVNDAFRAAGKAKREAENNFRDRFYWKKRNAYRQALQDVGVEFSSEEDIEAYMDNHVEARDGELKSLFRGSMNLYPKSWVDRYKQRTTHLMATTGRGSYNPHTQGKHVLSLGKSPGTMVHELGHGMEESVPGLVAAEHCFLRMEADRRFGKNTKRWTVPGHNKNETAVTDTLLSDYAAKTYAVGHYSRYKKNFEVITVGMEALMVGDYAGFEGHFGRRKSPQHRNFLLGALMLHGRPSQ